MTTAPTAAVGARTVGPAALLGAARGLAQLGLALATVVIARDLGVDGLGRYAFFTSAGSIGVASVASGLAVAATRDVAQGVSWSRRTLLGLAPLMVPGAAAVVMLAIAVQGPSVWEAAIFTVASYALSGWLAISSAVACGAGRYRRAAAGEAAAGTALPVLTVLGVAVGAGLHGALLAVGGAALVGTLIIGGLGTTGAEPAPRTVASSVPFVLIGVAAAGYARLDALAVYFAGGESALGLYSAAYRLLGPVLILTSAFGSVFFAEASRAKGEPDRAVLRRGVVVLGAMVVPVAAIEAAAAPWIIDVLYGPGFEGAVAPARVLLLAAIPLALYWPFAHALTAAGHERTWARVLGLAAVVDAVLAGWWVMVWGVVGAAAAWVVTESCVAMFLVWRSSRRAA